MCNIYDKNPNNNRPLKKKLDLCENLSLIQISRNSPNKNSFNSSFIDKKFSVNSVGKAVKLFKKKNFIMSTMGKNT
jgi:hypothetical protein